MRRTTTLLAGLAAALMLSAGSAAGAPIPFGSDLAGTPSPDLGAQNFTAVNAAGGTGALPVGYSAPADGVVTGWRLKHANGVGTGRLVRFHVVRGNTSIYKGPAVDIGTTNGISSFPVSVLVKTGDHIGLTNDSGAVNRPFFAALAGATVRLWDPQLGDAETREPDPVGGATLLIQADLDTAASVCGGAQATIAGTDNADVIFGTAGNDVIVALGGNDIVRGLGGDDIICGGDGDDKLKGGAGKDRLDGEAGRDKLRGGADKDYCNGGPQPDNAKKCEKVKAL